MTCKAWMITSISCWARSDNTFVCDTLHVTTSGCDELLWFGHDKMISKGNFPDIAWIWWLRNQYCGNFNHCYKWAIRMPCRVHLSKIPPDIEKVFLEKLSNCLFCRSSFCKSNSATPDLYVLQRHPWIPPVAIWQKLKSLWHCWQQCLSWTIP